MIIVIQKMITPASEYTRYYPDAPSLRKWGLWISASGRSTIPSGHPYPPGGHPPDHDFNWRNGRILDALQIVLITEGRGLLETRESGKKMIEAGMAFLLLPGVWHRYRPDPSTGWNESWIEIRGPLAGELLAAESILARKPIRSRGETGELEKVLHRIHCLTEDPRSTRPELSAEALRCLALLSKQIQKSDSGESFGQIILRSERYLSEHYAEALDMEDVARKLGVSYSSFRRSFRRQTGLSPWQYVVRMRLETARRLLAIGDEKLEEIASRLGFSSAFHLSTSFKKAYGISPGIWRKKERDSFG
jgi:AraC-like DNA-binding protein